MPKLKLTDMAVKKLKPPPKAQIDYWDLLISGFGIRVSNKGRKSWILMTRAYNAEKGKKTLARFTLGTYPAMSLGDARKAAGAKLDQVAQDAEAGIDTRTARTTPPVKVKARTIEDAVAEFFRLYVENNVRASTAEQYRIAWYVHTLPRWPGRSLDDITRSDIINLLDEIAAAGKPISANRTLSAISKFFNWAAPRYDLGILPTLGVEKPTKETARERTLNESEIEAFWKGAEEAGWPFGPFVQMLAITAQRRGEVAAMQWQDVDLDNALWTIPAALTKAGRTHEVPLSALAVELLENLPRLGDFIFTTRGDRPLSGFSKMKARLHNLIGFDDWTLHDLRRTAGTNMAALRVAPSTISRVLNHAEGGVTKIYVRYGYLEEKRDALNTWAHKLESIVAPSDDNVVLIRDAAI
jgi:integrase